MSTIKEVVYLFCDYCHKPLEAAGIRGNTTNARVIAHAAGWVIDPTDPNFPHTIRARCRGCVRLDRKTSGKR